MFYFMSDNWISYIIWQYERSLVLKCNDKNKILRFKQNIDKASNNVNLNTWVSNEIFEEFV